MNWENILRDGTGSRQETEESRIWAPWAMLARPVGSCMKGQPSQSSAVCDGGAGAAGPSAGFWPAALPGPSWTCPDVVLTRQEAAEPGRDASEDSGGGNSGTRLDRGSAAPCSLRPKSPRAAASVHAGGRGSSAAARSVLQARRGWSECREPGFSSLSFSSS